MAINLDKKPKLSEPFPKNEDFVQDEITGIWIPKRETANIEWRAKLLEEAENDVGFQEELMTASMQSINFWTNAFVWTYHQFDVDENGRRVEAKNPNVPFITWDIQDKLFYKFNEKLKAGEDILIDKCRDMGASWSCIDFMHWLWLFVPESQLLEMSRTEAYVDQTGNMKALFQKHDYINRFLPEWMRPQLCLPGEKFRTKLHLFNEENGSCIDGESTSVHAGSGDRRKVLLLDEFAKVEYDTEIRSATRDVALMRIINSTPAGAGTEYARWKKSGQIEVFQLPFWEHPEKGQGRYVTTNELGEWEIRSPWFNEEEKVRSARELAQEVLCNDVEAGDSFFTISNIERHKALFGEEPKARYNIKLDPKIPDDEVWVQLDQRNYNAAKTTRAIKGPLRVWGEMVMGRPDQSLSYIVGCDISKGQGASNSVLSVKCRETNEKIAEWVDANTPPYEMARVAVALGLWVGGKKPHGLPFFKWEMNGPGWDFGRQMVRVYQYPHYYRDVKGGRITDKKTDKYGWHSSRDSKIELLTAYDRALAHGGYINHSIPALEEATLYIYSPDGSIEPAHLVRESSSAKKTHGDMVIADALTIVENQAPQVKNKASVKAPKGSMAWRKEQHMRKKAAMNSKSWRKGFDFGRT